MEMVSGGGGGGGVALGTTSKKGKKKKAFQGVFAATSLWKDHSTPWKFAYIEGQNWRHKRPYKKTKLAQAAGLLQTQERWCESEPHVAAGPPPRLLCQIALMCNLNQNWLDTSFT